jgi:hypothetical protein
LKVVSRLARFSVPLNAYGNGCDARIPETH